MQSPILKAILARELTNSITLRIWKKTMIKNISMFQRRMRKIHPSDWKERF